MAINSKNLPGPKGVPLLGNILQVKPDTIHNDIQKWGDEFGDVFKFRLGHIQLIGILDHEIIAEILKERPDGFIRQQKMGNILKDAGAHGLFTAEGDEWKLQRKIITKGLDVKHQQTFFPSILTSTERLFKKWDKMASSTGEANVQQDLFRFTVDVTTSLAFGIDMNTQEQSGGVIQDHMEKIFPTIFKRINSPIPFHKLFKTKTDREFDVACKVIQNIVNDFVKDGKKRIIENPNLKENPENMLDAILAAADEEGGMENKDVTGNLLTILLAGEDTTSHSLAWAASILIERPDIQEKCFEEVNAVLGDKPFMDSFTLHTELKYTEAVIMEALRLKPVAPIMLFEPLEDTEIKGYEFKKGERLLTHMRSSYTRDENFSRASEMIPERWLKGQSQCPHHNVQAFTPFGSGPRFCPGRNLAMLEMKMVLSMLIKNFKISAKTPQEDIKEIMAFTMMPSRFEVKIQKR